MHPAPRAAMHCWRPAGPTSVVRRAGGWSAVSSHSRALRGLGSDADWANHGSRLIIDVHVLDTDVLRSAATKTPERFDLQRVRPQELCCRRRIC